MEGEIATNSDANISAILLINPPAIPTAQEPEVIPAKRGVGSPAIPTAYEPDGSQPRGDPTNQSIGFVLGGSCTCRVSVVAVAAATADLG